MAVYRKQPPNSAASFFPWAAAANQLPVQLAPAEPAAAAGLGICMPAPPNAAPIMMPPTIANERVDAGGAMRAGRTRCCSGCCRWRWPAGDRNRMLSPPLLLLALAAATAAPSAGAGSAHPAGAQATPPTDDPAQPRADDPRTAWAPGLLPPPAAVDPRLVDVLPAAVPPGTVNQSSDDGLAARQTPRVFVYGDTEYTQGVAVGADATVYAAAYPSHRLHAFDTNQTALPTRRTVSPKSEFYGYGGICA
eukprot:SAG22_NODE_111_length_19607_cov_12.696637_7_plen_249_part_00